MSHPWRHPGRRSVPLLAGLVAAAAFGGCTARTPAAQQAPAGTACAIILSTNDTHGQIYPRTHRWSGEREVGGSAVLAARWDAIRDTAACPVFVFSGGDVMQGTAVSNLLGGASTIAAFNALGYDAAALGNHEFDWGIEVLLDRISEAEFPFLGANVLEKETGEHPDWLEPFTIIERDGVRIGVIGLATIGTPETTGPWNVETLDFRPISEALDRYIPIVRAEGVDFVVALLHAGGTCAGEDVCDGEAIRELGKTVATFDYAVTGHTHTVFATVINGAPVVQSGANTSQFGLGRLDRDTSGAVSARILDIITPWADEIEPDPEVRALVAEFLAETDAISEATIGVTMAQPLFRVRGSEAGYALGRLIADAQREATGAEVAIMNNGGIRTGLAAGEVTFGEVLAIQPFENTLIRLNLPGDRLLATLEHVLSRGSPDAHISGMSIVYDPDGTPGHRVVRAALDDGRPIENDGVYIVTANTFMVAGGSGYEALVGVAAEPTGIVDLDALIEYLRSLPQPVQGPAEPRWTTESGP